MSCGMRPSMRSPASAIRPWSIGTKPLMALNRVVLPAPLGPITATTSPAETRRSIFESARKPPNPTDTSLSDNKGCASAAISSPMIALAKAQSQAQPVKHGDEPPWEDQQDRDHQAGDEKLLVARKVAQQLGRERQHHGAEDRTGEVGEPADHDDAEVQDQLQEA